MPDIVEEIERIAVPLDKSKIKRHEVEPKGLELTLATGDDGVFDASLFIEGFPNCKYGNIKSWNTWSNIDPFQDKNQREIQRRREKALEEFKQIKEAVLKGDYTIHVYANGEIKVDVKYDRSLLNSRTPSNKPETDQCRKTVDLDEDLIDGYLMFDDLEEGVTFFLHPDNPYLTMRQTVPPEIVQKGDEAVWEYARAEVGKAWAERKKKLAIEEGIRKNPIPIQAKYTDGTVLEGRIIEATHTHIKVRLDKPLEGEGSVNYNSLACAQSGSHVFTERGEISSSGYEGANQALHQAYKHALKKPTKDLVDRLNKRNTVTLPNPEEDTGLKIVED